MKLELDSKVREHLHTFIDKECLFRGDPSIQYFPYLKPGYILPNGVSELPYAWCFYLRNLTHNAKCLNAVSRAIALGIAKNGGDGSEFSNIQLCGIETSSIPLLTGIQLTLLSVGIDINVFVVRKDRKAYGLCHYVDGKPTTDPVVFVDDMINSGQSFYKAMEVCKHELDLEPAKNMYSIISPDKPEFIRYNDKAVYINSIFHKNEFDTKFSKEKYWLPKDCDRSVMKRT